MQSTLARAVVLMSGMAFTAIVVLELFKPGDNNIAIGHVLTIAVPTTAGLLALLQSARNGRDAARRANGDDDTRETG